MVLLIFCRKYTAIFHLKRVIATFIEPARIPLATKPRPHARSLHKTDQRLDDLRHRWPEFWLRLLQLEIDQSATLYKSLEREIATELRRFTWTQRAIASANRESDFAGYSPSSAGSTIWSSESMSCSCGVAHRTNDCWDLG